MKRTILIYSLTLALIVGVFYACNKKGKANLPGSNQQTIIASQNQNSDIDAGSGPVIFKPVIIDFCTTSSGICGMQLGVSQPTTGQSVIMGSFKKGECVMVIKFVNMVNDAHLGGNDFTMSNDFTVPDAVATALGGNGFTIKAGLFPIITDGNEKIIQFPCNRPNPAFEDNPFDIIGDLHNQTLDYIRLNKARIPDEDLTAMKESIFTLASEYLCNFVVKPDNNSGTFNCIEKIKETAIDKYDEHCELTFDEIYVLEKLNSLQIEFMDKIVALAQNAKQMGITNFIEEVKLVEKDILKSQLNHEQRAVPLINASIARHSALYWYNETNNGFVGWSKENFEEPGGSESGTDCGDFKACVNLQGQARTDCCCRWEIRNNYSSIQWDGLITSDLALYGVAAGGLTVSFIAGLVSSSLSIPFLGGALLGLSAASSTASFLITYYTDPCELGSKTSPINSNPFSNVCF